MEDVAGAWRRGEFPEAWRGVDIACRLPNRVTIYGGMHPQSRFSLFAILLLLICFGNLWGIGLALLRRDSDSEAIVDRWGSMAMIFLACGQILYLVFIFAWLFEWMRFFPGNRVQSIAIYSGFFLSAAGLVTASCGVGVKRLVGVVVAFTTAFLWLTAAVGSSAG
jgi:hypothetical protein